MLWKVQQDFCQQSSSTSPRPPTTTAGTRLEPMTSSPISGPASSPISGLTTSSPISGSVTSGLGISGSTTSGLACGSNSSVSSQYSSSAYSACSPPTSTSFWQVLSDFRFKFRFWSNLTCFDEFLANYFRFRLLLPVPKPVEANSTSLWRVFFVVESLALSSLNMYWSQPWWLISFKNFVLATYDHLANWICSFVFLTNNSVWKQQKHNSKFYLKHNGKFYLSPSKTNKDFLYLQRTTNIFDLETQTLQNTARGEEIKEKYGTCVSRWNLSILHKLFYWYLIK